MTSFLSSVIMVYRSQPASNEVRQPIHVIVSRLYCSIRLHASHSENHRMIAFTLRFIQ